MFHPSCTTIGSSKKKVGEKLLIPFNSQLDLSPSEQDNTEDQDDRDLDDIISLTDLQAPMSTPSTPTPTSGTSSPVEFLDSPSTASTNAVESSTRGIKRKAKSVPDVAEASCFEANGSKS